jgi:hypothetical protein
MKGTICLSGQPLGRVYNSQRRFTGAIIRAIL